MPAESCHSIKRMLADYLVAQTDAQQVKDICVVTLPFQTLDDRWLDVFIEPRAQDYFLINDGGKAVNELILQGMRITEGIEGRFVRLASRFGVAYTDEMFQTGAKLDGIPKAVSSVGMCSMLAMTELLEYAPQSEEEPIRDRVHTILHRWGRKRAKVSDNVAVAGEVKQHRFDFLVVAPKKPPVSVSILNPTAGALSAAERFGFKIKDLAGKPSAKWRKVAIETKCEVWSSEARNIVEKCADEVITIHSTESPTIEKIGEALSRMVA